VMSQKQGPQHSRDCVLKIRNQLNRQQRKTTLSPPA
jgi:hypothetical protein